MDLVLYFIIGCLSFLFFYYYLRVRNIYSYWKRKGVKHPTPIYFLGNSIPSKIAPGELCTDLYQRYPDDNYIGFYEFGNKRLLIMDPSLIQNVLKKDFSHFTDRGPSFIAGNSSRNNDGGIFFMTGHKWRAVRNKLSPTFTTGKLKIMFDRMTECYNNLEELIENNKGEVEAREMMFSYTIDLIASCAFGLDIHKEKETAKEFRRLGLKALAMNFPKFISILVLTNFPILTKIMNPSVMNLETAKYFGKYLQGALKYRRDTGFTRNDFLQLLIQLKDKGSVEHHSFEPDDEYLNTSRNQTAEKFEFTENMVMGQAFTFITAGMEPSGNTLTLVLSELAWHQDIQDKVRKEINFVLKWHHNKFTYDSLKDMEYLDECIFETLRLHPVAKQIRRVCTKQYRLDDSLTLEVGDFIVIPVKAISSDEKYFENPTEFNPDRFKYPGYLPGTFLPFGDGPRICIGMRFALAEMKLVLSKLIQNYRIIPGENFVYPIPLNRWSFFSVPSKPINIQLEKIQCDEFENKM